MKQFTGGRCYCWARRAVLEAELCRYGRHPAPAETCPQGNGQHEPGIGKSRLTKALTERIATEPHLRLRFYCSPYHTNSALHPVIEQLERAAGFAADDDVDARIDKLEAWLRQSSDRVADVAPLLAALCTLPTGDRYPPMNLTPQGQKAKTFEALLAHLESLADRQPVLMVLEDAHWTDPSTGELFELLIDRLQHLPILLLIIFRPDFSPPWAGHTHLTSLTLSRLGRDQGAAVITRLTEGKRLPDEILDQILRKGNGVPLFVEELTKTVLESGRLQDAGDHYELTGSMTSLEIPATLHDSLMARLDRLPPARQVAQIGAVIGREFGHELVAAVAPMPEALLRDALEQLTNTELIFRRGVPPEATYAFKHALVRDAAYESLLRSSRLRLHARIAEVLEERFAEIVAAEPELLAQHYTEGGLAEPAIRCWLRAGEHAARRSAYLEAIAHLRRGLALVDALPDPSDRIRSEIELQTALGRVLIPLKGQAAPEVGESYTRAEDLCRQIGDASNLYAILQGLWHFHAVRAELGRARELAERCHAIAQRDRDPARLLAAHLVNCGSLCWAGDFGAARDHLRRALRVEGRAPRRSQAYSIRADLRVFMRGFGSYSLWHLGHVGQAVQLSEEAADLAREAGDPFNLALALDHAAMLRQFGRDYRAVGELASAAMDACSEHRFTYYMARATFLRGWAMAVGGQLDDGIARMRQGLADLEATGCRLRRPYFLALLAEVLIDAGQPEQGLEIVADALALAETTSEHWRDADLQRTKGRLLLALSRERAAEEADACFRNALEIARKQNAKALELQAAINLAQLWRDQSKRAKAYDLLAPIYGWFTEGFDTADLKDAKALLNELQ